MISKNTRSHRVLPKQQYDQRRIGNAIFPFSFSKKQQPKLMNRQIYSMLNNKTWYIGEHNYTQLNWNQIIHHMKEATVKELYIDGLQIDRPIVWFSHIVFSKLTYLSVADMKISNGEALAFLDMPNLEFLELSNNLLTNGAFLTKLHFQKLKSIYLQGNRIKQLSPNMHRFFIPKNLQASQVACFVDSDEQDQYRVVQSIQFMAKVQKQQHHLRFNMGYEIKHWGKHNLHIINSRVITQLRMVQVMKEKFSEVQSG